MSPLDERAAVRRLLDRFGFGPRPGQLDAAGFEQTLAALFAADDPGVKASPPPQLGPEPDRGGKQDPQAKKQANAERKRQVAQTTLWWLDRMVAADASGRERLTWFWHGHFATSAQKVRSSRLMLAQNETLRTHGLGDFGVLAKAMIVDPALLVWLDGQKNKTGAANENLAREFMELFTLGVGHYSETDVREAARALTGWKVDRDALTASLVPKQHDTKDKTVLGHTGDLDAAGLVDVLLAQPAGPRFLVSRLWLRLVGSTPPDDATAERLVGAFGPGRDVSALLRAIAAEPAFRDPANTVVKQPVEWLVGLLRAWRIRPAELPDKQQKALLAGLRAMGQVPFLPPSVGGWPAGGSWLTTASSLARLNLATSLAEHARFDGVDGVEPMGALLGVDSWSERTKAALSPVAKDPAQLGALAAAAPEYVVSG